MKKYNISKPEKYMSNGVEKTYWANVGTMTEFDKDDGSISRIIEIPAIGLKANIFAQERKEEKQPADTKEDEQYAQSQKKFGPVPTATGIEYPESINPEDIPF